MSSSPRPRSILQAVGIGLFIIGIAVTGSAAYGELQSTPYLIQIDQTTSDTDEPTVSYSELTDTEREVFNRIKSGGAAPVKKFTLTTFTNNAVQHQEEVYTFNFTYDPVTLTMIWFGLGVIVSIIGGVLFFFTSFITDRNLREEMFSI